MQEQWTSTLDTREAAACGTLGIPARLETTFVEKTGQRVSRFHLAACCLECIYQTKPILTGYRKGTLEQRDAAHPFLTIQRGFINRLLLLDLQNQGKFCRLARVPGTELWQYVPGESGLAGITGNAEVIRTTDLKLVAALGVCGLPLLRLEGTGRNHAYFLPRYGPARADGKPPVDGHALRVAWCADKESVPWEDPFAQAMRGLYNRERFLDAVNRDAALVLLQKPRSQKAAFIHEAAGEAALRRVQEHFDA